MNSPKVASTNRPSYTGSGIALFSLGMVGATPGALDLLDRTGTNAAIILARHQRADFGSIGAEDVLANKYAIGNGGRILSAYLLGGESLWIVTEADRSSTTLLLPDEY
ncbi:hypothetical protein CR105_11770 [Massilia eurypsychrophila]|uniref:Type I restriction endonuclease subunit M n=1 Tax=Massilia eurypsychrophila TaxID=1485217 RepID=A0A2G8TEX0_9BURK|nr:hypothetical protein [Massilia eurypsychrophila]PIL44597.1 hypothetical protein CR105_11770 [Massilia eurypsychrophila]